MSKRNTLFAVFTSDGVPVNGVYHFNRRKLETLVSERQANGQSVPGEHIVQCTVVLYRKQLEKHGLPIPGSISGPLEAWGDHFQLSLNEDELSHLLHALDVSIADIEARAALPGESAESIALGSALLEQNRALRGRLAGLLVPAELQG